MLDLTIDHHAAGVFHSCGSSPVLLVCEHASAYIDPSYQDLGLAPQDRYSHAVWDPGAFGLARALSLSLNAPLVFGKISRLVYDCNRHFNDPTAIPSRSELIDVPGNSHLSPQDKQHRINTVYLPFCELIDTVAAWPQFRAIITIHSFTPVFFGEPRSTEIGLLQHTDSQLLKATLSYAHLLKHRQVDCNKPYGPEHNLTHAASRVADPKGWPSLMLEIRNDLLRVEANHFQIAKELLVLLRPALTDLDLLAPEQPA